MTALLHDRRVSATAVTNRASSRLRTTSAWLIATACLSLAIIVGVDGSPTWRVIRVLIVLAVGTAAVLWTHASSQGAPGACVVVGVPAFIAGAGIGVPHVTAGMSVTAVAGMAALLSGVTLLVLALVMVWRRTRWWGRAAVVLGFLALAQWVLFPVSTAVFATNRAPMPLPAVSPAAVGLEFRDVTLTAPDGLTLAAWYVPSSNRAAVVLLHGAGSTRANVLAHARVLSGAGYGVLLLDARGHGNSAGHAMDFGWFGDDDIRAATTFLEEQPDVDPQRIGAVGLSMGGEEAVGAAASVPAIQAVVGEGVTGRRGVDWLALQPPGVGRWFSTLFYAVQDTAGDVLSQADLPTPLHTAVVSSTPRPMLLIASGEVPQEIAAGRLLRDAAPQRIDLWEVEGAGHTRALAVGPDEWTQRVVGFLDRTLLPTAADVGS